MESFNVNTCLEFGGLNSLNGALGNWEGRTPDALIILMASLCCWAWPH
jgi:hypothetical protein